MQRDGLLDLFEQAGATTLANACGSLYWSMG